MKNFFLSLFVIALSFSAFAQNSTEADEILQSLEKEFNGTELISINFSMVLINTEANIKQFKNGQLTVSNNQFDIQLGDIQIICNGKTKWTILKEDEMIQISHLEEDEETFNLSDYFTNYKDRFYYKMASSKLPVQIVELTPIDPELETKTIMVQYNQSMNRITQITEENKEGTQTIFNILSYDKKELGTHTFQLDDSLYSDFEIEDLR